VPDVWLVNTHESGLGRSTAVGLYPRGATEAGVHDMAGTIFEWCSNEFYSKKSDRQFSLMKLWLFLRYRGGNERKYLGGRRAVRGGSWNNSLGNAHCAARFGELPSHQTRVCGV
jgi:formylglycine-generating enzyme required for sulfatase activity